MLRNTIYIFGTFLLLMTACKDDATGPDQDQTKLNNKIVVSRSPVESGYPNTNLYTINPDGSSPTQITSDTVSELSPSISPNGTRIAYETVNSSGEQEFHIINADGTNDRALTIVNGISSPSWSPDGSEIAFSSQQNDNHDIFIMNADGSGKTNLTHSDANEIMTSAAWSPDGSQLVYATDQRTGESLDIYTINTDGSNRQAITSDTFHDQYPVWSPDGSQIAFLSTRNTEEGLKVFTMSSDGQNITAISPSSTYPIHAPSWSPDGSKVIYSMFSPGNEDSPMGFGNYDLFKAHADGSGTPVNLTNTSSTNERFPFWSQAQ